MYWKKLGKIYSFKTLNKYLSTHAANPLAIPLYDDVFRVFFSGRDTDNKSSVGFVDIDIVKKEVIKVNKDTLFKYGEKNSFYSHGVSIGNRYSIDDDEYILFMGWQIRNGGHWRGDIGQLRLSKNAKLSLSTPQAFMSSDEEDPISLSYPWVLYDEDVYKMWYGSTLDWSSENGEMIHVIKYATSKDAKIWNKHGLAVPYELGVAQAFSRPTVIKDNKGYHMWFSFRAGDGTKYRIGYAHSFDGICWDRKENSGIDVSASGWDSEMICYPFVFDHKQERYMLYNGNDYGKEGFGLAVMEK